MPCDIKVIAKIRVCLVFLLCMFFQSVDQVKAEGRAEFQQVVFGCHTENLADFRAFATAARDLGATHVTITAEDLPIAYWELSPPDDPYPAWVITNPGILKIAPPEELRAYIPAQHGEQVMSILQKRCAILRELGLKAAFHTFEPQMLPESVFQDHPDWRGPRVDHPLRSRNPRYAPSMTHPDVLELYTKSMTAILQRCPEIEIIQMRTNDSGAGIEWSDRLYAGKNGNPRFKSTPMSNRITGFFRSLQAAAKARGSELHVNMYNVHEPKPKQLAATLDPNMAVDNLEGPNAQSFKAEVGSLLYYHRPFSPTAGIPIPVKFLRDLQKAYENPAKRLFVSIGDRHNRGLYLDIYERFVSKPSVSSSDREALLLGAAAGLVGKEHAADLVKVWHELNKAEEIIPLVSSGGSVFILGCVHQRWLTRPFVPFPELLTKEEKRHYRPFLFQARSEAHADDLMDLQSTRLPEKCGGYATILTRLQAMKLHVDNATTLTEQLKEKLSAKQRDSLALLSRRLMVFDCLLDNTIHAVEYQRMLDEAKQKPSDHKIDTELSKQLARVAYSEIENIQRLIVLLGTEKEGLLLDKAEKPQEEYQRLLGPTIIEQLKKKIAIMHPGLLPKN